MDDQTKLKLSKGEYLPLMEAFYTIQGEGFFAGTAAYFLRIGGCDVGCNWCDVKESWDANIHPVTKIDKIIEDIKSYDVTNIVITGGEPLKWNLDPLTRLLKENQYNIHLETSGFGSFTGQFDWICLSPKKMQEPIPEIKGYANELKVIVNNKHDFFWAEERRKEVNNTCKLYLQPEWSKKEKIIPMIIDYIKINKHWSISLQTHKYMNIP
tara:strand:- start:608 stop:1240 length:633 start_codon:yes stop_codon:yes gene_type:complete